MCENIIFEQVHSGYTEELNTLRTVLLLRKTFESRRNNGTM